MEKEFEFDFKEDEKVSFLCLICLAGELTFGIVEGMLRGYDQLVNIVLDDAAEQILGNSRALGTTICRGTTVMTVCPQDGFEEIENPFIQQEE